MFDAGGANGTGEVGDRGLGHVRVHGGRGHCIGRGHDRVSAGLRVPVHLGPPVGAVDVGRAVDLVGRGHCGGPVPAAGHHGTGHGRRGRGRIRRFEARVSRARGVRTVRDRSDGHGATEALEAVVAGLRPLSVGRGHRRRGRDIGLGQPTHRFITIGRYAVLLFFTDRIAHVRRQAKSLLQIHSLDFDFCCTWKTVRNFAFLLFVRFP